MFSSIIFFAFVIANKELSVLKSIKRAEFMVQTMILCLQSEHMTVPQILNYIKQSSDKETAEFIDKIDIKNLSNASNIALECGFSKIKTVSTILSEVFLVFGKYETKEQIEEMEFCKNKLRTLYENSEEKIKSKAKLIRYSGISLGIIVIILLL